MTQPTNDSVARLDDSLLTTLGGHSASVKLSSETARKQAERHPDLTPDDYARIQDVIDRGTVVREGERTLVLMAEIETDKWWRVVVKSTADGRETYLVTFHRIKPNQVPAARRRGVMIRSGGWLAPGGAHSLLAQPKPRV